ncbi:MAG: TonB-dependent receptor [Burkholderiales bacterium]|nr:TonB-dependent receptor [Burkholderiales bacterium]
MKIKSHAGIFWGIALFFTLSGVNAQQSEEEELALSYGSKSEVSIATGGKQAISRAPSAASVITAEDILAMGATDLDQALASMPGLHVSVSPFLNTPIYSFRGIYTNYNPQVLLLINGLPVTNAFAGNRSFAWGGLPLENVARIEVIRGPGSSLYGADAYSGVIDVITKTAADIKGAEFGGRAGSFKTRDAWLQYGGDLGPLQAAFYLRAGHTDGQHGIIQKDLQAILDPLFGTHASLAPGPISAARDALDARADLAYQDWRLRAAYQQRKIGTGAGIAESLDPRGRLPESRLYLDLTYQKSNWLRNWDLAATLGYIDIQEKVGDPAFSLFPAGAFGGAYPNGVIGNPGHSERQTHASVSAFYTAFQDHRIRMGLGVRQYDLYKTEEFKNFSFVVLPGVGPVLLPLPGVVDASGNPAAVYMQPHKRHLSYLFAQDEWSLAQDWKLTAGVRHDNYSDFGGTTNPRLALVWDAAYNLVVKLMHGRAFRAPSFTEQYTLNNPVNLGNPKIQPETIATNELSFVWQAATNLQTNLTLFHYHMRDIIKPVANADPSTGRTFQNAGDQTGRGLELEATWNATRNLQLSGNFSVQHSTDGATGLDAGLAPQRRVYGRVDWRLAPAWRAGASVNYVASRKRQPGDTRPPLADYSTADVTLRRERLLGNWDVRASVLNVFNRDAREPTFAPGNIPFDLPLPGRAFYLELSYKL